MRRGDSPRSFWRWRFWYCSDYHGTAHGSPAIVYATVGSPSRRDYLIHHLGKTSIAKLERVSRIMKVRDC